MSEKRSLDKTKTEILRMVAPGAPLREGIDNVLRANTGGLIVVGYNEKVRTIVDGGFHIECPFSSSYLYELAKMDGAIILNEKADRIILANAQLAPDSSIPSSETGMRHRTAERVAKETKALVIAISQRRNVITLYQGNFRYALKDMAVILTKANQAIQTLEKYKAVLRQSITHLGLLEFEESVTYGDVLQVMHRFIMVLRIKGELISYLNELGTEGRLIRLQMNELLTDLENEAFLIIQDYIYDKSASSKEILVRLQEFSNLEIVEDGMIMKLLGYMGYTPIEESIYPRGYRLLHKIPRLPLLIIENLVTQFKTLANIINASVADLDDVEGIGEVRAKKIKEGLRSIKEQHFSERKI
ncbi:DNA integrity scanning diadenylate cyclase DisA [Peribacillus deserti]|uniref:DNA integrity scanning protein DisA n=1 Tax=Peribacillus deserti TaxID=673318 RepID=A0A2N5MAB1_9BACI|nr:DNA integrity scanning diadenylate cyclase DisA [Peribacillus deserti]PLT31301.1 DNA integrity scanning protein DisA [Peribacillus deserti]